MEEEKHPGLWLYEEGMAYWDGYDFKIRDKERGQIMIEASASSGLPIAVAYCHYRGWNGLEEDDKKAVEMFIKIETETNGNEWAQYLLGECFQHGRGTDQDQKKALELYIKSAEQGNSSSTYKIGVCYDNGFGCDENKTKGFEWCQKSAKMGHRCSMYSVGFYYEYGQGVTKDLNKAKAWFARSAAQGFDQAQYKLDRLNQ